MRGLALHPPASFNMPGETAGSPAGVPLRPALWGKADPQRDPGPGGRNAARGLRHPRGRLTTAPPSHQTQAPCEDAARPRGSWRSPAGLGGDKSDSTPDSCQLPSRIRKRSKACGRPPPRSQGEGGMGLAAQIHCQRPGHLREAGPQRRRVRPAGSFRQRPCRARTWNPCQGAPGGRSRLEASQALWAPWARPSGAGPAPGPTDGVTDCRDRRNPAPQALLARGAA